MEPHLSTFLDTLFERKDEFLREDRYRTIAEADSFFTKIVGVSFEGRQAILGGLKLGDILQLVREPENAYDPCAIAVHFGALRLGYIRREIACHLAAPLDAGRRYTVSITSITGGGTRTNGVNIFLERSDLSLQRTPWAVCWNRCRT